MEKEIRQSVVVTHILLNREAMLRQATISILRRLQSVVLVPGRVVPSTLELVLMLLAILPQVDNPTAILTMVLGTLILLVANVLNRRLLMNLRLIRSHTPRRITPSTLLIQERRPISHTLELLRRLLPACLRMIRTNSSMEAVVRGEASTRAWELLRLNLTVSKVTTATLLTLLLMVHPTRLALQHMLMAIRMQRHIRPTPLLTPVGHTMKETKDS
mmetsp:Transcript_28046/g.50779  ORF Transcript_28046/g.50779 Transcript_28046/m.50779 type:complete len:216 (-) Transcript_28046:1258-1905(-)